jgi:SAM-dependent methyltransferase
MGISFDMPIYRRRFIMEKYQDRVVSDNTWHIAEEKERYIRYLDIATEEFNRRLEVIEDRCSNPQEDSEELLKATTKAIIDMSYVCEEFERQMGYDKDILKTFQVKFREKTNYIFSKSYFMNRARTWPQGYPGDYKTLEGVYRNIPMSTGIGFYLDRYFHSTTLAMAVRERRTTLSELLKGELTNRQNPKILDIACGSCREILELASDIRKSGARITCIDFDSDALDFSVKRLSYQDSPSEQIEFRKYNAMRMISHERNLKEFGMQDVIYSTGLFDYLEDNVLIRLIKSIYELLNYNGKLIISFKDCRQYKTFDYHWLVDWNAFYQRTEEDIWALFEKVEIPYGNIKIQREKSGVIIFFVITKQ